MAGSLVRLRSRIAAPQGGVVTSWAVLAACTAAFSPDYSGAIQMVEQGLGGGVGRGARVSLAREVIAAVVLAIAVAQVARGWAG